MDLVRACRDTSTFHVRERFTEEILFRLGPALREFITRHARADLVEDAFQETLIAIARGIERCQARTEGQFRQWCYRIARNKVADQGRKAAPRTIVSLDLALIEHAVELSCKDERMQRDEAEELAYALGLLVAANPPCAVYLWERYGLELPHEVIGEIHGTTADAARMKVARCLKEAQELVVKKAKVSHGG